MFPCVGTGVQMVPRLLKRLEDAKNVAKNTAETMKAKGDESAGDASKNVLDKFETIKKKMKHLQTMLCEAKCKDEVVMKQCRLVARSVDEMLGSGNTPKKTGSSEPDQDLFENFESKLDEIDIWIDEAINPEKLEELKAEKEKASCFPKEEDEAVREADDEKPEEEFPLERKMRESSAWSHLTLVIDSFDTQLKLCLFCLTIFPPNALIKKRLLIHWWMGENIIKDTDEGKRCFNQMISKGMIIPEPKKHCKKIHYCRMQIWIRRMLISLARSNAFLEFDSGNYPSDDFSRSHRACLRKGDHTPLGGDEEDKLRTVYNINRPYIEFEPTWLVNKSHLSTMQLGRWQDPNQRHHVEIKNSEFLEGLGNCKSLKYLSLRGISRVEKLPDSHGWLSKLVVLDLRACHNLEKLPASIGSASKLQYLDVSECYLLDLMPKRLADLGELQVLKGFVVGDHQNKNICQLTDLAKLTKLRKLSISIDRDFEDEELKKLGDCKALSTLIITWSVVNVYEPEKHEPPITKKTETLNFPATGIEKLDLRCFPKAEFPTWINLDKLTNLKKLYLRGGMLERLGDRKNEAVEVLRVRFLKHLGHPWSELRSLFPKLNVVETWECQKFDSWPCDEEGFWSKGSDTKNAGGGAAGSSAPAAAAAAEEKQSDWFGD